MRRALAAGRRGWQPCRERRAPDVQGHAAGVGQGLEEVLHQLRVKGADAPAGDVQVDAEVRPAREILHAGRLKQ